MARYIQYETADGGSILVEVGEEDVLTRPAGPKKAGLGDKVHETIYQAQTRFEEAIRETIQQNVQAFLKAVRAVPMPPTDVEVTFGLKATGELGNVAIAKAGLEANYTVKLTWKQDVKAPA